MKGVLPSTAVLLAVLAQPAAAAFTGTNGPIAMERPAAGGLSIAAGYGLVSTGWIGCALSLGGLAIYLVAIATARRSAQPALVPCE